MKIDRFKRHMQEGNFHALGAMVGHELPRNRLEVLREARVAIARYQEPAASTSMYQSGYATGYLRALADVMAAHEAELVHKPTIELHGFDEWLVFDGIDDHLIAACTSEEAALAVVGLFAAHWPQVIHHVRGAEEERRSDE